MEGRRASGGMCGWMKGTTPSLKDSHQEVQLTEGTAMAATESRFVLDDVADVFQLLVAQAAFVKPVNGKERLG